MEEKRVPITFNITDLWLMSGVVRHEMSQQDTWKAPPVDRDLNEQISFAIDICESNSLQEYTLLLNTHQLLVLDFNIRAEMKTPEGGSGKRILLKAYHSRRILAGEITDMVADHDEKWKPALSETVKKIYKEE